MDQETAVREVRQMIEMSVALLQRSQNCGKGEAMAMLSGMVTGMAYSGTVFPIVRPS